ncbi:hypothetical protein NPIL_241761, partial [Nephila pilipes]
LRWKQLKSNQHNYGWLRTNTLVRLVTTASESFVELCLRLFRRHFESDRNAEVLDQKAIMLWIRNFEGTNSILKLKPPGRRRFVRTPQQFKAVK